MVLHRLLATENRQKTLCQFPSVCWLLHCGAELRRTLSGLSQERERRARARPGLGTCARPGLPGAPAPCASPAHGPRPPIAGSLCSGPSSSWPHHLGLGFGLEGELDNQSFQSTPCCVSSPQSCQLYLGPPGFGNSVLVQFLWLP